MGEQCTGDGLGGLEVHTIDVQPRSAEAGSNSMKEPSRLHHCANDRAVTGRAIGLRGSRFMAPTNGVIALMWTRPFPKICAVHKARNAAEELGQTFVRAREGSSAIRKVVYNWLVWRFDTVTLRAKDGHSLLYGRPLVAQHIRRLFP